VVKAGFSQLEGLERTGALRLLVCLLDGDKYISQLIRRHETKGISSQPALEKTRTSLDRLGLIEEREEFNELTKKTRLYLQLTPKGRKVANHTKEIVQVLSEL
jgi:DNA-binding PadR family transcriptional regulator